VSRRPLADVVRAVIAQPGVCEPQDVTTYSLDPSHVVLVPAIPFGHLVVDDDASKRSCLTVDATAANPADF